jgi:hypothetical protein
MNVATYKVIQDIEAEDTLVGPLTLRQCIYAAVAVIGLYLCFVVITKHAAFLVLFLLPFIAFGIFFAFPWSKQQPTEVWALAKVRFYFKPRKRIWNQSGVKQLVTITVPKVIKNSLASNLTPVEVKSRLKALADTIDSRGWAIKNVDLGYYTRPSILQSRDGSDRLVDASSLPQPVASDAAATGDIFDLESSPVAQKFDQMMAQAAGNHRQQIVNQLAQQPVAAVPQVIISPLQPTMPTTEPIVPQPVAPVPSGAATQAVQPVATVDYSSLRSPLTQATPPIPPASQSLMAQQSPMTAQSKPAILELANNNDLNVATIAREAQARSIDLPGEVNIPLH